MEPRKILIVDDEDSMRHMLTLILRREGYEARAVGRGSEALALLEGEPFDFILSDVIMPEMGGLDLLRAVKEKKVEATIIMMSAYGNLDTAVEAMKLGAYDYVSKPFKPDEILLTLRKAEEREHLRRENQLLRQAVSRDYAFANIIGKSAKMVQVFETIKKISDYKASVLILGESGTGKEMVAKAIHFNSPRSQGSVCRRQLRGDPGDPPGKRAFRLRKGGLHRCQKGEAGKLRNGPRRNPFPG